MSNWTIIWRKYDIQSELPNEVSDLDEYIG
jgi:hypothetical protein